MSITAFQKVTLVTCIVLCISLFVPSIIYHDVKKDMIPKAVGPGHYPTGMPRKPGPGGLEPWEAETAYPEALGPEAVARASARNKNKNKKSNHFGQVVPIYGVGILLYILHIFVKLTRKDKKAKRCPSSNAGLLQNISEEELARLEARLSQAEMMINRVLSPQSSRRMESSRSGRHSRRRESSLLRRLRKFRRSFSFQGEPMEGVTPEMEAEEVPYAIDWEGYAEEVFPQYDEPCGPRKYETIIVEAPDPDKPSAEELAERMENEEAMRELAVIREEDEDEVAAADTEESRDEEEEDDDEEDDDDDDDEEGEETEETEETEDDDPMRCLEDYQLEEEEEEEEEEEVDEETPCLSREERMEERNRKMGLAEFLGLSSGHQPALRRRHITFSDQTEVFTYSREGTIDEPDEDEDENTGEEEDDDEEEDEEETEDEEGQQLQLQQQLQQHRILTRTRSLDEDPLMEAESLRFVDHSSDPEEEEADKQRKKQEEEQEEEEDDDDDDDYSDDDYDDEEGEEESGPQLGLEEFLSTYRPGINPRLSQARIDPPPTATELRMRNKSKDKDNA